jgi:RNA polymerase sigma-70 factor (ECF subfamily)
MTTAEFEATVRAHQGMVFSIACHFFGNAAMAEEIAQDVFLQLFEHRRSVAAGEHAVRWLRRTVTHRCIDRTRHRRERLEIGVADLPDVPCHPSFPDPLMAERLRRLVASLPETPRMVVILRYGEGLEANEIARLLDMPVRTVWSHLRRSIALMREKATRLIGERVHEPARRRTS